MVVDFLKVLYNLDVSNHESNRDRSKGDNNMALTRKLLKSMGIEDEKIDQIIDAHTETVDAFKQYKADAEKLAEVQKELDDLKAKGDNGLQKKYDELKAEYDKYKSEVEAAKALAAKKEAYAEIVKDAGLSEKGAAKAMKYTDWDKIELDESGKVKSSSDHIKALKEEWAEYVIKEGEKGANTPTPPANGGSSKYTSKADIMKIKDTSERQKAIAENIELFQKG